MMIVIRMMVIMILMIMEKENSIKIMDKNSMEDMMIACVTKKVICLKNGPCHEFCNANSLPEFRVYLAT